MNLYVAMEEEFKCFYNLPDILVQKVATQLLLLLLDYIHVIT